MNGKTRVILHKVLENIPDIEPPLTPRKLHLTSTHYEILEFLKSQKHPKIAKTISARLGINYDTVRARLHELHSNGFVYQPLKGIKMEDLNKEGMINPILSGRKCGYLIVDPKLIEQ